MSWDIIIIIDWMRLIADTTRHRTLGVLERFGGVMPPNQVEVRQQASAARLHRLILNTIY